MMFLKCPYLQLTFAKLWRSIEVKWQTKIERPLYANPPYPDLHWHRKLIPSVAHKSVKTLVDNVAVRVTVKDFERFHGIHITLKGTGERFTTAVIPEVGRLGLCGNIINMSSDTTAPNTGQIQWSYTRIEREFGHTLF